jgi:hypothetical protein
MGDVSFKNEKFIQKSRASNKIILNSKNSLHNSVVVF